MSRHYDGANIDNIVLCYFRMSDLSEWVQIHFYMCLQPSYETGRD